MEQSIARFEKRLDEANDALKTLGGHLGTGARGSYKEVTSALTALRRSATKTNKQALADFDKLRSTLKAKTNSAASAARSTKTSSGTSRSAKRSTTSRSTASRKTASRKPASRKTASRSTAKRATSTRSTAGRSRAKKS